MTSIQQKQHVSILLFLRKLQAQLIPKSCLFNWSLSLYIAYGEVSQKCLLGHTGVIQLLFLTGHLYLMSGLAEVQNANVSSSYVQEFLICQELISLYAGAKLSIHNLQKNSNFAFSRSRPKSPIQSLTLNPKPNLCRASHGVTRRARDAIVHKNSQHVRFQSRQHQLPWGRNFKKSSVYIHVWTSKP